MTGPEIMGIETLQCLLEDIWGVKEHFFYYYLNQYPAGEHFFL